MCLIYLIGNAASRREGFKIPIPPYWTARERSLFRDIVFTVNITVNTKIHYISWYSILIYIFLKMQLFSLIWLDSPRQGSTGHSRTTERGKKVQIVTNLRKHNFQRHWDWPQFSRVSWKKEGYSSISPRNCLIVSVFARQPIYVMFLGQLSVTTQMGSKRKVMWWTPTMWWQCMRWSEWWLWWMLFSLFWCCIHIGCTLQNVGFYRCSSDRGSGLL